jgi:hypothetical protein
VHSFAAGLAERGHDVEVICEVPNHPQGRIHEGYRRRPLVRRSESGFRVSHVWVFARRTKSTRSRIFFYGTYAIGSAALGCVTRGIESRG